MVKAVGLGSQPAKDWTAPDDNSQWLNQLKAVWYTTNEIPRYL
jgi:hypothetical protein